MEILLFQSWHTPSEGPTVVVLNPHVVKHLPVERQVSGWVKRASASLGGRHLLQYPNPLLEFG